MSVIITDDKLKEYVVRKCHEAMNYYLNYTTNRNLVITAVNNLHCGGEYEPFDVRRHAQTAETNYMMFVEKQVDISQLCYTLGDEYIEIYERLLGNIEE